jgi:hypothetical protein
MSAFTEPVLPVAPVVTSLSDTDDSLPMGFYRGPTDMARRQAPVEVRSLPQSPMLLSPGVVEILASLSPAKMLASA